MKLHSAYYFLFGVMLFSFPCNWDLHLRSNESQSASKIEYFTFSNDGKPTKGKVYLPASHSSERNLPVIFLIDFTEQHFKLARDEFDKVIAGVEQLEGFNALVVSLKDIADIDAEPDTYQEHYRIYSNMATYVSKNYSNNASRTFIGKGSEAGVVLMTMFMDGAEDSIFDNFIVTDPSPLYASAIIEMIGNSSFPLEKSEKKLHVSFSTSNDRVKCSKLIDLINKAQYPWLQFKSKEYTHSDYENTYPIAFVEGLEYIFKNGD